MLISKCSRITDLFAHPVHSITNSKTRLEMALIRMRITSLPVFIANLHYNSGVGTFLLRIATLQSQKSQQLALQNAKKMQLCCAEVILYDRSTEVVTTLVLAEQISISWAGRRIRINLQC